jgi:hypothetical protein
MPGRIDEVINGVAVRQSAKLRRVEMLLRQRRLGLADERLGSLDQRHHPDVKNLILLFEIKKKKLFFSRNL